MSFVARGAETSFARRRLPAPAPRRPGVDDAAASLPERGPAHGARPSGRSPWRAARSRAPRAARGRRVGASDASGRTWSSADASAVPLPPRRDDRELSLDMGSRRVSASCQVSHGSHARGRLPAASATLRIMAAANAAARQARACTTLDCARPPGTFPCDADLPKPTTSISRRSTALPWGSEAEERAGSRHDGGPRRPPRASATRSMTRRPRAIRSTRSSVEGAEGGWLVDADDAGALDVGPFDISLSAEVKLLEVDEPETARRRRGARRARRSSTPTAAKKGRSPTTRSSARRTSRARCRRRRRRRRRVALRARRDRHRRGAPLGRSRVGARPPRARRARRGRARMSTTAACSPCRATTRSSAARDATWKRLDETGRVTAAALVPGESVVVALDGPDRPVLVRILIDGVARIIAEIDTSATDDDVEACARDGPPLGRGAAAASSRRARSARRPSARLSAVPPGNASAGARCSIARPMSVIVQKYGGSSVADVAEDRARRRPRRRGASARDTTSSWSSARWARPPTSSSTLARRAAETAGARRRAAASRARHARLDRRARDDGAALDRDPRARARRDQLHREPVRHPHQRPALRRAHHRGAPASHPGRARRAAASSSSPATRA